MGPASWNYAVKTFKGRKGVIKQESLIKGEDDMGTVAVLKIDKVLRLGALQASIYLENTVSGWAGLVFMVGDVKNYHILELGFECKLSKVVNSDRKFMRKNKNCKL
jgi:hypothetical protein